MSEFEKILFSPENTVMSLRSVGSVGRPDHENALTAFCERLTAFCGRVYRDAVCWSGLQIGDGQTIKREALTAFLIPIGGQLVDHINKHSVTAFLDALTCFL